MAWTCDTDGRQLHCKGPFIWWTGEQITGWPQLNFKDICKWDLQALGKNIDSWEVAATDRDAWRHTVKLGLSQYKEIQRKQRRKSSTKIVCLASRPTTAFICSKCDRAYHLRIGLHSHNTRCTTGENLWSHETDVNETFLEHNSDHSFLLPQNLYLTYVTLLDSLSSSMIFLHLIYIRMCLRLDMIHCRF